MALDGEELIRRFLLHILPKGFMRIRHYGFLANRCRRQKLAQIRQCLQTADTQEHASSLQTESGAQTMTTQDKPQTCPKCKAASWVVVAEILPRRIVNTTPNPQLFAEYPKKVKISSISQRHYFNLLGWCFIMPVRAIKSTEIRENHYNVGVDENNERSLETKTRKKAKMQQPKPLI